MEEFNYSSLGNKLNKTVQSSRPSEDTIYLSDLFDATEYTFLSEQLIYKAFCNELKRMLMKQSLKAVVEDIFKIEAELEQLAFQVETDINIPSMEGVYKNLSPTFLRSIWENLMGEFKEENIKHGWLESIRIAVEQELYVWQEKTMDS